MSSANMDPSASNIQPQKWQAAKPQGKQEQKVTGKMTGYSVSKKRGEEVTNAFLEQCFKGLEGSLAKNEAKPGQPIKFKAESIKIGKHKNYGALPTEKGAKEILLKELGMPEKTIAIFSDRLTSKQIGNIRNAIDNNDPSKLKKDEKETYEYLKGEVSDFDQLTDIQEKAESLGYGGLPVSENLSGDIILENEGAGNMSQSAASSKGYTTLPKDGAKAKPYTKLSKGGGQEEAEIREKSKGPYAQLDISKMLEKKKIGDRVRGRAKSMQTQTGYSEFPSSGDDVKQGAASEGDKSLSSKYGFSPGRGNSGYGVMLPVANQRRSFKPPNPGNIDFSKYGRMPTEGKTAYGVMPPNLASKADLNQVQKQRVNTAPPNLKGYSDTNSLRVNSQKLGAKKRGYNHLLSKLTDAPISKKSEYGKPIDALTTDRTGKKTKIKNVARSVSTAIGNFLFKVR